ncbi:MAG: DUF5813 family protein [Halobacteriales archaeon]
MTGAPDHVRQTFASDPAYERVEESTFAVTTTRFDVIVAVETDEALSVTVRAPTLSAAVDGEVADVVEEGWLETFERRIADLEIALEGTPDGDPSVAVEGEEVVVEIMLADADAGRCARDARAAAEFVEGTYMEGVIPGYEYRDPVAGMRERAMQNAEEQ